jgi:predicted MPP superfamily phosphohydrolase
MFLSRLLEFYLLNYYAYVWLGIIAIAFSVFLVEWIFLKFFPGAGKIVTIFALAIIGLISFYSLINGLRLPIVKEVPVTIKNLPVGLDGFTIVQLSDLHLESFKSKKAISAIVKSVNALKPDLIFITGDLIEGAIDRDNHIIGELKKLHSVHGIIAVTGNHEFYAGIQNFMQLAKKTNIKILRNQCVIVEDLQIIGLDDDEGKRFNHKGPDLDSIIKDCDQTKPIILLYHRPTGFDSAVEKGVDLQLSGHSHAGQIPPMDILVHLVYKYPAGLYERNGSYIYTSPGAGYWGPPMRFLNKAEITQIILKRRN